MQPILGHIGPFPVHSYGLFLTLSFVLGGLLALRRAAARGLPRDAFLDIVMLISFASLIGARLMYVIFHRDEMRGFLQVITPWSGGAILYGGVLAAMVATWLYCLNRGIPFLLVADAVAPSLSLGLCLTRIGCFLNGCCYGVPSSFLGVRFPDRSPAGAAFGDVPLLPAQLFSSATGLVSFGLLLALDRKPRPVGLLFAVYLILDSVGRFALDFVRSYESSAYLAPGLTVNQIIGIALFGMGLSILMHSRPRHGVMSARN